jgi:hypothetical protein
VPVTFEVKIRSRLSKRPAGTGTGGVTSMVP